jgi:hypothetical protein
MLHAHAALQHPRHPRAANRSCGSAPARMALPIP